MCRGWDPFIPLMKYKPLIQKEVIRNCSLIEKKNSADQCSDEGHTLLKKIRLFVI
jgi:hypothetical protein